MNLRKLILTKETIFADFGKPTAQPITREFALAVVENPFAGRFVEDLSPLFAQGTELGRMVMKDLVVLLPRPACSYGKAALVGAHGEMEHGAAIIHPNLGQPMRAALGGGEAIICSNVKIGGPGTSIDVPLTSGRSTIWTRRPSMWRTRRGRTKSWWRSRSRTAAVRTRAWARGESDELRQPYHSVIRIFARDRSAADRRA